MRCAGSTTSAPRSCTSTQMGACSRLRPLRGRRCRLCGGRRRWRRRRARGWRSAVSDCMPRLPGKPRFSPHCGGEDVAPEVEQGSTRSKKPRTSPVCWLASWGGRRLLAGVEALPVAVAPRRGAARTACPSHWRTFGQRASLLTGGPWGRRTPRTRYSTTSMPAFRRGQLRVPAVGLDPTLGIFHMDRDRRDPCCPRFRRDGGCAARR